MSPGKQPLTKAEVIDYVKDVKPCNGFYCGKQPCVCQKWYWDMLHAEHLISADKGKGPTWEQWKRPASAGQGGTEE